MAEDVIVGAPEVARLAAESVEAAGRLKRGVQFGYGSVPARALGDLRVGSQLQETTVSLFRAMEAVLKELARSHDIEATKVFAAVSEHQKNDTENAESMWTSVARYFGL